jgi:hypothetical protein
MSSKSAVHGGGARMPGRHAGHVCFRGGMLRRAVLSRPAGPIHGHREAVFLIRNRGVSRAGARLSAAMAEEGAGTSRGPPVPGFLAAEGSLQRGVSRDR